MSLFGFLRSDLPFDQEDAHRYLPWVIGVMTALAAFMMAAGVTLGHVFVSYTTEFEHRLQIQIPYADGEEKAQAQRLRDKLVKIQGVERAAIVTDDQMGKLLGPWLGSTELLALLPVPAVVDVWLNPEAHDKKEIGAAEIRRKIAGDFPGATVDDYRQWAADFHAMTTMVKRVAWFMALLIVVTGGTVVLLISRASVQLHFPIVTLLHRMGAHDSYISRQFQLNAAWLTFKGAFAGALCAGLFYAFLGGVVEQLDMPLLPDGMLFTSHLFLFSLLPLFMSLFVASTTRLSVQSMIQRLY